MTTYHLLKVRLLPGQKQNFVRAFEKTMGISLRLKRGDTTSGSNMLHLTEMLIKKLQQAAAENKGAVMKMSETQLRNMARFIKAQVSGKVLHVKETVSSNGQGDAGKPSVVEAPPPPYIGKRGKKK